MAARKVDEEVGNLENERQQLVYNSPTAPSSSSLKWDLNVFLSFLPTFFYLGQWYFFSAALIIFNKYMLTNMGFKFPFFLTFTHQCICFLIAWSMIKVFKVVDAPLIDFALIKRHLIPIGVLFACSLATSNFAYLYLSAGFIQMLKALTPIGVLLWSLLLNLESPRIDVITASMTVSLGIAVVTNGELNFNLAGFTLQIVALAFESLRLALVQIFVQSSKLSLNAITTTYFLSPISALALLIPAIFIDLPQILQPENAELFLTLEFFIVLMINSVTAFGLNVATYLLIKNTSSLTMTVGGVIKDWIVVFAAAYVFNTMPNMQGFWGFVVSSSGLGYYGAIKYAARLHGEKYKTATMKPPVPLLCPGAISPVFDDAERAIQPDKMRIISIVGVLFGSVVIIGIAVLAK